jgi:hypothetical protein
MLLVQEFLKTHSFDELEVQHGVFASIHKSKYKFSLNYDKKGDIEAKDTDPLACQCRGLILATADGKPMYCEFDAMGKRHYPAIGETVIVAHPMNRFFNEGQGAAAPIKWSDPNLKIFEKLDGTLIIVHFDHLSKQWHAATRSVCEADLLMDNKIFTFRTLFEKALKDTFNMSWEDFTYFKLDSNITYCFELTTPYNQIVVKYETCRITLIAARDKRTDLELPIDSFDFPKPHTYNLDNIQQILEWVSTLNPMEHEGVVVMDGNFNRIKVKNANYVAFSKCRDSLSSSPRNCLEIILNGKEDDVIAFLPQEIINNLLHIKKLYTLWLSVSEGTYQNALAEASSLNLNDKKTFALTLDKYTKAYRPACFSIFSGKADSIKDFIHKNRKDGTWSDGFLDKILQEIGYITA